MSENLQYKSDVFSMLMQYPAYALDVYNSMNNTHHDNPDDLEVFLLENGISLTIRNDASFIIYNNLCVYEHQSTFNPNMAIRELIYFSSLIMRLIREEKLDVYGKTLVTLPTPQFKVFYNGLQVRPEREIFRLSDSFNTIDIQPPIELICEAININSQQNTLLKQRSFVLDGYCKFVESVRKYKANNHSLDEALDLSIDECIREHILEDFFRTRRDEVKKVTLLDFTFEQRIKLATETTERNTKITYIQQALSQKGSIPDSLQALISSQNDTNTLDHWFQLALTCKNVSEFAQAVQK